LFFFGAHMRRTRLCPLNPGVTEVVSVRKMDVTLRFKGQSWVHLIHAPKKTTYIITKCIEINVTITSEYLLHCGSLTK
jgi:2-phospho-L-lactate guanylyltransferase (CobY/MobA/RfbA family)